MRIACVSFLIVSTLLAACGGAPTESEPEIGVTSSAITLPKPITCKAGEVIICTTETIGGKKICWCDTPAIRVAPGLAEAPEGTTAAAESEIDVASSTPPHVLKGRCPPGEFWFCTNETRFGKTICGCNYETPDDAR